jgi:uncharacterized membrane protein YccC
MTRLPAWLRTALAFDAAKWRPISATRSAAGVAACMAGYTLLGQGSAGLLAELGALNTGLASQAGVYRTRVRTMCITAVLMSFATALGVLVGRSDVGVCIAGFVLSFGAAVYSVSSPAANTIAVQAVSIFVVLSGLNLPPSTFLLNGAAVLSGGVVQIVLLTWIWPMNPLHPEREAVAEAFISLSDFVRRLPDLEVETIPSSQALQEAHSTLREGSDKSITAEHKRLECALEQAEAIRAALVAFAAADREFRELGRGAQIRSKRICRLISRALRQRAEQARRGTLDSSLPVRVPKLHAAVGSPGLESYSKWLETLSRLIEKAPARTVWEHSKQEESPSRPPFWHSALQSMALHHALRYAITLEVALAINRFTHIPHSYWLPLTVSIVLRQDYVSTIGRGVSRLVGTLAGVALATLLIDTLHPSAAAFALLTIVVMWFCFGFFQAGYAAYSVAITMFVVFSVSASGLVGPGVGVTRIVATLCGLALSLAAYFFWPAWHWKQMWEMLGQAADAQIALGEGISRRVNVEKLRSEARSKRLQSEALFQAASLEPRGRGQAELELAGQAVADLDRNAAAILSIGAHEGETSAEMAEYLESAQRLRDFVSTHSKH